MFGTVSGSSCSSQQGDSEADLLYTLSSEGWGGRKKGGGDSGESLSPLGSLHMDAFVICWGLCQAMLAEGLKISLTVPQS